MNKNQLQLQLFHDTLVQINSFFHNNVLMALKLKSFHRFLDMQMHLIFLYS